MDWLKTYKNYVLGNLDAYYLAIDAFFEFPDIKPNEVGQLIYDEFGFDRFKLKTFHVTMLVNFAKNKYEALAQNYASEHVEWNDPREKEYGQTSALA